MTSDGDNLTEITIGNIGRDFSGNVSGRDVTISTITIGGQPTPVDKRPTINELKLLLIEIHQQLIEVAAQKEALKQVSTAAPFTAQGVEESIKDMIERIEPEVEPEKAKSVQDSLAEATNLLSSILNGAKVTAEKASEVGTAVKPIVEKLEPLMEKIGVAALWVAKLWLAG